MSKTPTDVPHESEVRPQVYLLDVEGTTSPISLIAEQLFPYARRRIHVYLHQHAAEPEVDADFALLLGENIAETAEHVPRFANFEDIDKACDYLYWLMDQDCKSTALKSLQGKVWKSGFENGELKGTVFPDVPSALARWSQKARVAIYSSGSVEAQQLLFRHSSHGDLTPFLSAYFDTRTGPKTSPYSYRAIAAAMNVAPSEILFLSDLLRELDPAREAGCQTRLSVREGNPQVLQLSAHLAIHSFAEL
jgi:enolase-phosphatase E1